MHQARKYHFDMYWLFLQGDVIIEIVVIIIQ